MSAELAGAIVSERECNLGALLRVFFCPPSRLVIVHCSRLITPQLHLQRCLNDPPRLDRINLLTTILPILLVAGSRCVLSLLRLRMLCFRIPAINNFLLILIIHFILHCFLCCIYNYKSIDIFLVSYL